MITLTLRMFDEETHRKLRVFPTLGSARAYAHELCGEHPTDIDLNKSFMGKPSTPSVYIEDKHAVLFFEGVSAQDLFPPPRDAEDRELIHIDIGGDLPYYAWVRRDLCRYDEAHDGIGDWVLDDRKAVAVTYPDAPDKVIVLTVEEYDSMQRRDDAR